MAEDDVLDAGRLEPVGELVRLEARGDGRVVGDHDPAGRVAVQGREGAIESTELAPVHLQRRLGLLLRRLGGDRISLPRDHVVPPDVGSVPEPGPRHRDVADPGRVGVDGVDPLREDGADLGPGLPPVLVVPLQDDLGARAVGDPLEVRDRRLGSRRPRQVPRQEHEVGGVDGRVPGGRHPGRMVDPLGPEPIHGLARGPEGQVGVGEGEHPHGRVSVVQVDFGR